MSLQWTVIATFLYFELACCVLLLLPWISSSSWRRLFQSGIGRAAASQSKLFFRFVLVLLIVCFFDSILQMSKYNNSSKEFASMGNHLTAVEKRNMILFRAQRNYYIAGFSLFLWFVLQRLFAIINVEATLEEHLKDVENSLAEKSSSKSNDELISLTNQLAEADDKSRSQELELKAVQSRAKSLSEEYDRMTEEFKQLQDKYDSLRSDGGGDKKVN